MAASSVTADQCKSWEKSGKEDFLRLCRGVCDKTVLASLSSPDLRQAIYDVCHHVVKGNLKPDQLVSAVNDLKDQLPDLVSLLVDILGAIDVELSCTDESKSSREKFTALVQTVGMRLDCEAVLKSRLDHDTLENAGLVSNKTVFTQRHVKIKTRLYYKQQKFNLLREESEGYSKLIAELNQELTEKLTPEVVLQNIKSLIGCFNLDPNRVIDILLESFENHPDLEDFYIPLIKSYVRDNQTLCHILGFKFHFFENDETPASLYRLAALLLKNDLVLLDTLYPHLYPSDNTIIDHSKKELSDAKTYARKLMVINLADKTSDEKKKEEDNTTDKVDPHKNNQKLGLVEALLSIGAWEKSKCILDRLPDFFATTYKPVATALCALIHTAMDPAYRRYSGMSQRIVAKRSQREQTGCNVTKAATYRELNQLVFPMMAYLGPYAACDPILIVKLVRLGKTFMSKRNQGNLSVEDNQMYYGLLNVLEEAVLPSLSFLTSNCCISEEVWSLMKLLPYELRYRMYGNWKNELYQSHPRLVKIRADCLEKSKYIMKRLSKENVKPSGRQLGKLSHSNPGVLFEYVIKQIEKYDNLIGPVVDSLKFLTNLSYDILIFCIIEAVASPEKEKMKFDDTSLSLWLQSLANFAGSICKKYPVDLSGMMQYVTNQLKAGKSIDLLLLREIVQKMAGIEISEEITTDQLEAMSGGELLRQEGGYFTQVRNTKKSSNRLKDTVLEHDLALSLCLLISQQRDAVIYKEGTARHLKLIGKLYDQCQDTLVQFGSFLSMQLSTEEFVRRLPAIDKMVGEYHVPPDAAFFLSRPLYSYEVNAKFDELRKAEKLDKEKKSSSSSKLQRYLEAADLVMNPVIECVRPLQSPKIWEDLSPTFYVTFWSLSMYDIHVPTEAYAKQVSQLTSQMSAIDDNKDLAQSKKKKEKDRCNQLLDKLKDEEKRQSEHVQRVLARLKNQKESWFVSRSTKNETITQFLQLCIFPRCCFTANDSVYCAEFIHILHSLKTPNFSTLICYDRIFCDITYTVSSCTENEAHRYGRFLCAALETVMRWHSNKQYYEKECGTYPGFVTVFRKGENSNNKADQLDFENYRHVCHKWHFRITKAMVVCIESGNYIQIRNALIILTKILPHYPRIVQFGSPLERRIDRLHKEEKDKRPDLYALAMGYSGQLKGKKNTWVNESDFHHRDKEKKEKAMAAAAAAAAAASSGPTENGVSGKTDSGASGKDKTKMVNGDKGSSQTKDKEGRVKTKTDKSDKPKTEDKSRSSDGKKSEEKREATQNSKASSSKDKREKDDQSNEKRCKSKEKTSEDISDRQSKKEDRNASVSKRGEDRVSDRASAEKIRVKEERQEDGLERVRVKEERSEGPKEKKEQEKAKELKQKIKEERENYEKERRSLKPERSYSDTKVDKRDKTKEERHERAKLKRSYSPEEARDAHVDDLDERSSTSSSHTRSHHLSPEQSPRHSDERDLKRRKTDIASSSSKEDVAGSAKYRHHRSQSPDLRDRDRKEKKRAKKDGRGDSSLPSSYDAEDYSDNETSLPKHRRSQDPPSSRSSIGKLNGDSDDRGRQREDRYNDEVRPSSSKKDQRDVDVEEPRSRTKEKKKDKERSSSKRLKKS